MNNRPLVSVYMTTYYHEKYIRQAIESVLKQKVNFTYEIVISDDCSKDHTIDILKEYEERYETIKVNYNKENIGLTKNQFSAKSMCSGEYIIPLAGDDYWIDEQKLQKQVDFLHAHKEYFGVTTVIEERVDTSIIGCDWYPSKRYVGKKITLDMFLKGHNFPLNGIMTSNYMLNKEQRTCFSMMPDISPYIDDVTDSILILQQGNVFVLPDVTVAYRVRRKIQGDRNFNSQNKGLLNYQRHIEMLNNLEDKTEDEIDLFTRYAMVVTNGLIKSILLRQLSLFRKSYNTIPLKYRKRGLMAKCILRIPADLYVAVKNRIKEKLDKNKMK